VGVPAAGEIAAYNAAHTKLWGPRPIMFDYTVEDGFRRMRQHYLNSAAQSTEGESRAVFLFRLGDVLLWRGDHAEAEAILIEALSHDGKSPRAEAALFRLGLARLRQGRAQDAAATWGRLSGQFPHSPWASVAAREQMILSWGDRPRRPVNWPVLEAVRTTVPPTVDGSLDDACWRDAPAATEFNVYRTAHRPPDVRNEARACYDDTAFYLGVVCFEPHVDQLRNPHREHDSAVWSDDCVELFIDPHRSYTHMYELEVGAEGGLVDVLNVHPDVFFNWEPAWTQAVGKQADRWVVEMAIPWAEMRNTTPPRPGDVGLCNVVRCRLPSPERPDWEAHILSMARSGFKQMEYAAMLLFR